MAEFLLGGGTIDVALVATLASSPCWCHGVSCDSCQVGCKAPKCPRLEMKKYHWKFRRDLGPKKVLRPTYIVVLRILCMGFDFLVPCKLAMWCHFNIAIRISQHTTPHSFFNITCHPATYLRPPSSVRRAVHDGKSMGSSNRLDTLSTVDRNNIAIYIYRYIIL